MDMAAAAAALITSIRRMRAYLPSRRGWNGLPQVEAALDLASEKTRSPNETRTRLLWVVRAGLPGPLVNREVFDLSGRLLGFADLLDLDAGWPASTTATLVAARAVAGRHPRSARPEA
jgi:hypothetical protein